MFQNPTEAQMDVWRAFLRAHARVIKALEREMQAEQSLPLTWYEILVYLSEAPDNRLRLQSIAESVLLSRSGITRLVDRMVEAGLVRREPCPFDRRGSYAVMTSVGQEALRRAASGHLRGIKEHFARHLEGNDVCALRSFFDRILQGEGN